MVRRDTDGQRFCGGTEWPGPCCSPAPCDLFGWKGPLTKVIRKMSFFSYFPIERYFSHEREQFGLKRVGSDLSYIRDTAHVYPWFQDFELIDVNLFQIYSSDISSTIWGHLDFRLPPLYAAFVNGVAVRDALLFALKSH